MKRFQRFWKFEISCNKDISMTEIFRIDGIITEAVNATGSYLKHVAPPSNNYSISDSDRILEVLDKIKGASSKGTRLRNGALRGGARCSLFAELAHLDSDMKSSWILHGKAVSKFKEFSPCYLQPWENYASRMKIESISLRSAHKR